MSVCADERAYKRMLKKKKSAHSRNKNTFTHTHSVRENYKILWIDRNEAELKTE